MSFCRSHIKGYSFSVINIFLYDFYGNELFFDVYPGGESGLRQSVMSYCVYPTGPLVSITATHSGLYNLTPESTALCNISAYLPSQDPERDFFC